MTGFPISIDSFTNPTASNPMTGPGSGGHAQQHSDVNDAITAVEIKVGINSSLDINSLDSRTAWVPGSAEGDLPVCVEPGVFGRLRLGALNQVLTIKSTGYTGTGTGESLFPAWETPAGGSGSVTPLFDHFADVGNVGGGEDDLYSDTIAASTLGTNGDKICAEYAGSMNVSGTTLRAYFAGTKVFDSGAISLTGAAGWELWITIIRESSSAVRVAAAVQINSLGTQEVTYTPITGLTLSGTNVLKITGQGSAIPANNDIVAKMGFVEKRAHA